MRRASLGAVARVQLIFTTATLLCACASSTATKSSSTIGFGIDIETMDTHQAAEIIDEFVAKYGIEPVAASSTEVTSMTQVREIIRGDRLPEYENARRFTAGKHGAEALALRASLELSLAGAMLTTAAILEEERTQLMTELRQLTGPDAYRETSSQQSKADAARTALLQTRTEDLRRVVRALRLLSEEPLTVGADFAKQAVRHDSRSQLAYLARANSFRLRGEWLEFDRMMRYADDDEANPPLRTFLRAMEAWERYANRAKCRELLRETLARQPDFVRAQANLVLVNEDVEQRYAELQRLKALRPNHIVVRLGGPMIEGEHRTVKELEGGHRHK